MFLFVSVVNK